MCKRKSFVLIFPIVVIVALLFFSGWAEANGNPLDSWTVMDSQTDWDLYGVAYGYDTFAAVGAGNVIDTSPDGATWTVVSEEEFNYLNGVTYANDIFVAVGDGGIILNSIDGDTWTEMASDTSYSISGVTYGNGKFVAVGYGYGAMIQTSPDGATWTNVRPETCDLYSENCKWLFGVAYGNGKYVAVGYNSLVLTSTSGTSWTELSSGFPGHLRGVAYGDSKFVAVGGFCDPANGCNAVVLTSPTGTLWAKVDFIDVAYSPLRGIVYQRDTFVAIGEDGTILTSTNGIDWTPRNSGVTDHLNGVTYGEGTFVVVGDNGTILQSGAFPPQIFTLDVIKTGTGSGTVTSSEPGGIDCGSTCSKDYTEGTEVTLTATEASCSTFAGWTGCNTSSLNICYVTMDDNKTVTAEFNLMKSKLSISPRKVSMSSSGGTGSINVGTSCSWTASSNAAWITITSGSSGTGNGTINYSVAPNGTGESRIGTITVQSGSKSKTFNVRQSP